ncbi:MAG: hypothetical protein IJB36_03975 [Clostridia bacterium]|nr:hypothetical protein [Clostridia bacterium]
MEMGIGMIITAIMSALSAMCSVGCLVVLLIMATPKEEETPSVTADAVPPPSGREAKDDVEKRRRAAVQAKEHSNFMNYDGKPQQKIDPALILGE